METAIKSKKRFKITDDIMIYFLFVSVFLPFYLTAVALLIASVYIIKKRKLSGAFEKNGGVWLIAFTIYTVVVALCNLNFIGAACSVGFIALLSVMMYARRYFTPENFEKCLDISCFCGIITAIFCVIEYFYYKIILSHSGVYRCTLYFFNSNYLATVLATVIIVCGYKVLYHKGKPAFYYAAAAFSALGAYLTGSMFVWIEVLIGGAALLLITRRHQMLSALLLLAGTACMVLYFIPEFMPRLQDTNVTTDNRVIIWKVTIEAIKTAPIFGRGFLTYFHVHTNYEGSYPTAHAHNILLEPILSFGIIGTVLIVIFFVYYYKRVITCRNAQNKYGMSSLILALTCAILVHSTTDLTFMWIQTGLFYCLIMGGVGIEERMLKIE